MRRKHQLFAVLVGACLMLALPATTCRADGGTTITVNSNSDTSSMSNCVLRDAITAANTNTTTGGCAVGMGGGPFTIVFDASLIGDNITLSSTLTAITSGTNLTITGPTSSSSGHNDQRQRQCSDHAGQFRCHGHPSISDPDRG